MPDVRPHRLCSTPNRASSRSASSYCHASCPTAMGPSERSPRCPSTAASATSSATQGRPGDVAHRVHRALAMTSRPSTSAQGRRANDLQGCVVVIEALAAWLMAAQPWPGRGPGMYAAATHEMYRQTSLPEVCVCHIGGDPDGHDEGKHHDELRRLEPRLRFRETSSPAEAAGPSCSPADSTPTPGVSPADSKSGRVFAMGLPPGSCSAPEGAPSWRCPRWCDQADRSTTEA